MMDDQAIFERDGGDFDPEQEGVNSFPAFTLSGDIMLASEPQGVRAEVLRSLRTQIIERHVKRGRRGLAVCGASQGVGVSFMAANLAVAFARAGAKTLLIDANMRMPSVHCYIVPGEPVHGLAHCLDAGAGFTAAIQHEGVANLSVLYAGGPVPDALERLSGPRFQPLIDMCMRDFDITIADTPPANLYADALRIAGAMGNALVVLRRHVSFVEDVDVLLGQLAASRAGVIGSVLNEY